MARFPFGLGATEGGEGGYSTSHLHVGDRLDRALDLLQRPQTSVPFVTALAFLPALRGHRGSLGRTSRTQPRLSCGRHPRPEMCRGTLRKPERHALPPPCVSLQPLPSPFPSSTFADCPVRTETTFGHLWAFANDQNTDW